MRPRARDGCVLSAVALNMAGSGPGVETAWLCAPQSSVPPTVGLAVAAPEEPSALPSLCGHSCA